MEKRIMAFDVGDRRIGIAVSDPFCSYAVPLETYFRTGKLSEDINALLELVKREDAGVIVCGLPLHADGTESEQTEKTRRLIRTLQSKTEIPIYTEDERFTTLEAREDLARSGISAKKDKRKKAVDSLAAAYILERFLSREKEENRMSLKEDSNDYEDDNSLVELVDEDGVKLSFEHLLTFEHKNEWYVALEPVPVESSDEVHPEDDEIAIYHLVGGEDDEQLETIEDEALLDELFDKFCDLYEDSEDAEDAAESDEER